MFANSPINFCTFYYKATTYPKTIEDKKKRVKYSVEYFFKLLARFVERKGSKLDDERIKNLDSCQDCDRLIQKFCSIYHKIKCLELELIWKLENLGNVMKLADKVPSRVKTVRQFFEKLKAENIRELQEVDLVGQDGLKKLKDYRMEIINKCFLGRIMKGLQPHVLLERIERGNKCSKISFEKSNSTVVSNIVRIREKVSYEWVMRLAALVYLVALSPSLNDHNGSGDFTEPLKNLISIGIDDDTRDTFDLSSEPRNWSRNDDNAPNEENSVVFDASDNFDLRVGNFEDTDMTVELKHTENCNQINVIATQAKPLETQTVNRKFNKLKPKKKIKGSIQNIQLRFHCALCKTSHSSYGGLRKHKNNAFHRFLRKKTLKIFVNFRTQINEDIRETPKNDKNNSSVESGMEKSNTKRYNLRQTRKKTHFVSDSSYDDHSDVDFSNEEDSSSTETASSSSSSETSDTDNDNLDVKPNIQKKWNRLVCPEVQCSKSFFTTKGLQTHRNLHGTFPCKFCDNWFTYAPDLACHENEMHTKTGLIKQEESKWISQQANKLKCPRCPLIFFRKIIYTNHFVNKHLGLSTTHSVCPICQYPSNTESLWNHNRTNHFTGDMEISKISKCNQCPAYFRLNSQLTKHKKRVHKDASAFSDRLYPLVPKVNKFICSICALELPSGPDLADHEVNHGKSSEKYVTCPRCKKYMRRVKYTGHFMIAHLGANQKHRRFTCEICGSKVVRLDHHFKTFHKTEDGATKVYKCEEVNCKAFFIKAIQLIYHKRSAHNYNPLKCKYCGIILKIRGGMATHVSKAHSDKVEDPNLPLSCSRDFCKRRFETEADLEWHLKFDKHFDGSEELKCEKCGNNFPTSRLLKYHMETKCADLRRFICQICDKGFRAKDHLKTHLLFHKGPDGYEFQCQTCGMKFINKHMLNDHMTSHTGEKKYICQWCGEKYGYKRSWKKHVLTKHKDKDGLPEVKKIDTRNRLSRKGAKRGECVLAGVKR